MIDALYPDAPENTESPDSPAALARNRIPIDPTSPPLTYKGRKARKIIMRSPEPWTEWGGKTGYIRGRYAGLAYVQVAWQKWDDGRLMPEMIYLYPGQYEHADSKYRKDRKVTVAAALPG